MSFSDSQSLVCRSCNEHFSVRDGSFPKDLFTLLNRYNNPQIHWFCESCNNWRVTPQVIGRLNSRITALDEKIKNLERSIATGAKLDVVDITPCRMKCTNPFLADSTGSPPLRRHSSSPTFGSNDTSPYRNKDALRIIHSIVNKEIKIQKEESANSISVVDAFLNQLHPFLKRNDPVYKLLYSRDYKTGSSYNDLKILSADEYDINIILVPPKPFRLKVKFFEKTKAFAKIEWDKEEGMTVPENRMCISKFFDKHSEKGFLEPLKIRSWFQGLIDTFCNSNPKIKGIKSFKPSAGGPARTIKIEPEKDIISLGSARTIKIKTEDDEISLDLVPVFTFDFDILPKNDMPRLEEYDLEESKRFCSFVPKECTGEEELLFNDCKLSWRIYIPEIDKKVLHNKQCAKSVIKLLKLLRNKEDWKDIKSYHLVTVILWEIHNNSSEEYWKGSELYDMFIKALENLQGYLKNNCLPYFLYPSYNLFHKMNAKQCENWSYRIQYIVKSLKSDPNNLKIFFNLDESIQ